jgi:long-chain acyl-CoA synthetase
MNVESFASVPLKIIVTTMLFEPLFAHARNSPQQLAIIDDHGRYTFQQVAAMASGLGMYLSLQTEQPRVGLLLPSGVGFVASFYGTLLAGKSVVPINFLLGEREIAHILADSGIDTIVTIPQLAGRLKDTPLKIVDLTQLPQVPTGLAPKFPAPSSEDIAVLMYTSGTSGLPKGVILTYGNLQSDVDSAIEYAQLVGEHKFLGILPLFHSTGMLATMIAPIQLGAMTVFIGRFSPVATIKAIREHGVSVMVAVPSMYGALARLKDAGPADVQTLYAPLSGGEPLPANIRDGFLQKFHKHIMEGYGLTETIGPVTVNIPQAHRPGSVGRPMPGVIIKITDDDGNALPQGQAGEVWLKGPMIMKGYFNLPNETADALTTDGFFKSGDLGMLDEQGYLHITGRKKDLIIVAGEKAVPREIEEALMTHPAVAEAAVMGKKDPSRGEVVVAFVVAREGQSVKPDELRETCRAKGLAPFKVPREIIFVAEFPRSPTGKVLKRVLAEQLKAE